MLIKVNGKATHRPVLSPDGKILAAVGQDDRIQLIDLSEAAQGRKFVNGVKITKSTRSFIRTCNILRWSPEVHYSSSHDALEVLSSTTSECDFGRSWLLLSDGKRVIALSTDLRTPTVMSTADPEGSKSNILADYDLGNQLGKISLLEFVFDHRHTLVISEHGSSAAILNLTRPQRDDVPHVKYPDKRSLAQAPDSRYFALLRRDKGRDRVTVFQLGDNNQLSFNSFDCNTSDAQNVTWCPTGQPLLAIADSPSYGVSVSFFTLQGHALKQLGLGGSIFHLSLSDPGSTETEGTGLAFWSWRRASQTTKNLSLQVLANDQKEVVLRHLSATRMSSRLRTRLTHSDSIDGSKTFVWLESSKVATDKVRDFVRQKGGFEIEKTVPNDSKHQSRSNPELQLNHVDLVELNSTHSIVATRLSSSPRTLFLWRSADTTYPHAVLIFKHTIRQIHFHPHLPQVLVALTNSKSPRMYAWYQSDLPPISGLMPIDTSSSTSFAGIWLPACVSRGAYLDHNGTKSSDGLRCPFLFTSNTAFDAGFLSNQEGHLVFESMLQPPSPSLGDSTLALAADESPTELIDTPSRPSRQKQGDAGNVIIKKARFHVPENAEANWKEDPLHEQAAYGHAW